MRPPTLSTPVKTSSVIVILTVILTVDAFAQPERPRLDEGGGSARVVSPLERIHSTSPDDPFQFILDRGIRVEDHPNGYDLHAAQAPDLAALCDLDRYLPCARILWSLRFPPVSGAMYRAAVPPRVKLQGDGRDVWWVPSVHCVTYEPRKMAWSKVSSGQHCMNIVDAESQQMEWLIGGRIEGLNPEEPGLYEGWIPVTITMESHQWIVDIPVSYERYRASRSCTASTGNLSVSGLPYAELEPKPGGTVTLSAGFNVRSILELGGDFAARCGTKEGDPHPACPGLNYTTGFFRFQVPDEDTAWSIDISRVSLGPGGDDNADWTWSIGYYEPNPMGDPEPFTIQTRKTISFDDGSDPYMDSEGNIHLYLAGSIFIPDGWDAGSYSDTATVTFTCGP